MIDLKTLRLLQEQAKALQNINLDSINQAAEFHKSIAENPSTLAAINNLNHSINRAEVDARNYLNNLFAGLKTFQEQARVINSLQNMFGGIVAVQEQAKSINCLHNLVRNMSSSQNNSKVTAPLQKSFINTETEVTPIDGSASEEDKKQISDKLEKISLKNYCDTVNLIGTPSISKEEISDSYTSMKEMTLEDTKELIECIITPIGEKYHKLNNFYIDNPLLVFVLTLLVPYFLTSMKSHKAQSKKLD